MPKQGGKKGSFLSEVSRKLMSIDKYGETKSFSIAGNNTYPSVFGTLITLIIFVVIVPFGFNKFIIMRDREDTNFQSTIEERAIDRSDVLTYE